MNAAPKPRAPLGLSKKLLFALAAIALVFGTFELGARVLEIWKPPLEVDYGLGFDSKSRLFAPDPRDPAYRITRPEKHPYFRRTRFLAEKPEGLRRIVAMGGSSVRRADAELQLMRLALSERTGHRIEVLNAGGSSYGTHRLVPVLAELLEYEPDVVLLYTGHNEFEEIEQLELSRRGAAELERRLAAFASFRLIRDGITALRVRQLETTHNARILSEFPPNARAWNHPFSRADVSERMAAYRRNLEIMVDLCRRANVPIVIGTVPSNLYRPVLPAEGNEGFREVFADYQAGRWQRGVRRARRLLREAVRRHQSSDAENEIIWEVARNKGVPIADVERRVIAAEPNGVPGQRLFRDHCHLNGEGRRMWRLAFQRIVEEILR